MGDCTDRGAKLILRVAICHETFDTKGNKTNLVFRRELLVQEDCFRIRLTKKEVAQTFGERIGKCPSVEYENRN